MDVGSLGKQMSARPTKCCAIGSYECSVPMAINGRRQDVDYCLADIIAALNAANIPTIASCCGHSKADAVISLADGREMTIKDAVRPWEVRPVSVMTRHETDGGKE